MSRRGPKTGPSAVDALKAELGDLRALITASAEPGTERDFWKCPFHSGDNSASLHLYAEAVVELMRAIELCPK